MTIDLSALPWTVALAVGERIEIPLPSYAGSGHKWSAVCIHGQEVAHLSVKLAEPPPAPTTPRDGTAEPPPLMLVPELAVVVGLARGEAAWRLVLARPFDPSKPVATHDLRITVLGSS
jgi:hypothetical protein